jgi:hypothetical protein
MGQRRKNYSEDSVILFCLTTRIDRYWPRSQKFHAIKIDCVANNVEHLEFRVRFSKFFAAQPTAICFGCAQQNRLNFKYVHSSISTGVEFRLIRRIFLRVTLRLGPPPPPPITQKASHSLAASYANCDHPPSLGERVTQLMEAP